MTLEEKGIFISFKILKDQKLVQKQTVTLYESPNTRLLEQNGQGQCIIMWLPPFTSRNKVYKHEGDKSITPCAKPGPLKQRNVET